MAKGWHEDFEDETFPPELNERDNGYEDEFDEDEFDEDEFDEDEFDEDGELTRNLTLEHRDLILEHFKGLDPFEDRYDYEGGGF